MIIKKVGDKSQKILKIKDYRLLVLEGAVRSGKTVVSLIKFYQSVLLSQDNTFLMAGATMGSVSRNCILGDFGLIAISGGKLTQHVDSDGSHFLSVADTGKKIYYVGADNTSSYKKIQGLSIGGFYADEVTNMDRTFFFMALTRSIASVNPFNIITLNPEAPAHWFYKDYLDGKMNEPNTYYFHFKLNDNEALTTERKLEIEKQFTGVFYKKYILGLRVRAEGSCYPSFERENVIIETIPEGIRFCQIGVDIGGNKSATVFTLTGFYVKDKKWNLIILDEMFDKENKSTESVLNNFKFFVAKSKLLNIPIADCYVDCAEQLIKKSIDNLGLLNVHNSIKNKIIDRIRVTDLLLSQRRLKIMRHCKNAIESFESAVWNEKIVEQERLDDGTVNIDSLDSFEYSFENMLKDVI